MCNPQDTAALLRAARHIHSLYLSHVLVLDLLHLTGGELRWPKFLTGALVRVVADVGRTSACPVRPKVLGTCIENSTTGTVGRPCVHIVDPSHSERACRTIQKYHNISELLRTDSGLPVKG